MYKEKRIRDASDSMEVSCDSFFHLVHQFCYEQLIENEEMMKIGEEPLTKIIRHVII